MNISFYHSIPSQVVSTFFGQISVRELSLDKKAACTSYRIDCILPPFDLCWEPKYYKWTDRKRVLNLLCDSDYDPHVERKNYTLALLIANSHSPNTILPQVSCPNLMPHWSECLWNLLGFVILCTTRNFNFLQIFFYTIIIWMLKLWNV